MDAFAPLLCVCLVASQQLGPWQRFPSDDVCRKNWTALDAYCRELQTAVETVGGGNADRFRDMHAEAVIYRRAWWCLWWIASTDRRDWKEEWIIELRLTIGDRAFYSGDWPGPFPAHHFPVDAGR